MGGLLSDLRYGLRMWRRQPGATAAAVLALALGIGVNTTVFSFVAAVLLEPLPYANPSRLVMLWQDRSAKGGPSREVISPGLFVDWSTRAAGLEGVTAVRNWSPNLTGSYDSGGDDAERLTGAAVSGAYFSTLGASALYGRTFAAADDAPGAPISVVLSHGLWQRRFGGNPAVIGTLIELDGQRVPVIGVMPPGFRGAVIDAELWMPLRIDPANAPRGIVLLRAFARLAPDTTLARAQAALSVLQARLQTEDSELLGAEARVVSMQDDVAGPARPLLLVLSGAVVLVLLIACANVTSVMMMRAEERRAEMSLRVALGAARSRLVRQLLTEAGLLAASGCAIGLGLAAVLTRVLVASAPASAPRLQDVRLDGTVLGFTACITVLAAVIAGLAPAVAGWRSPATAGLRDIRHARGSSFARATIVAAEITAAMALVVGAGLFVKNLIALQQVDLGFRPDHVMTASIMPPRGSYNGDTAVRSLYDNALERAARLPGVESASMTSVLPLSGMQINFNFRIVGRPPAATPDGEPVASFRSVGTNFFDTMGMRLIEGRGFTAEDRAGAPVVAVVNRTLAKRYFGGRSPIGAACGFNGDPLTIVGVVEDVHHLGPAATPDAEMYVPYGQVPSRMGWLVLKTTGDPSLLAPALRQMMREVDPRLPLASMRPMTALAAASVAQPKFLAALLSSFSAVAAVLALTGVYGLFAFSVSRRTREIGVRMALGASRTSVMAGVLGQSARLVLIGIACGGALGVGLSHVARSLLFGVQPADPETIGGMAALILAASVAASYLPARRAAGVDPVVALRDD